MFLVITPPCFGATETAPLADDPTWLKLLHTRRSLWGTQKSDIDGGHFFLSTVGQFDPQAELDATLSSIHRSTDTLCRYPARVKWLSEKIPDLPGLDASCPRLENWKKSINASSVWLVFASYYLNNPSSMYGHTFLRLGRTTHGTDEPLLDYTANFAAQTNTRNGLMFAIKGLAGGYPGTFSTHPYYMKVQQYNNVESRDLWEYKLNLSSAEIERLLDHLWELGPTSMSYYFLNKNCSYQLLPLLEVARPTLRLSQQFHSRAIPLDTMRVVLAENDLISEKRFRPSHLRELKQSRDALSPHEQHFAKQLVLGKNAERLFQNIEENRKTDVLETALNYWRYTHGFVRDLPAAAREKERELLLLRNQLPPSTPKKKDPAGWPDPPESAHGTGRVGLALGSNRSGSFQEVSVRAALHDLEEDPTGFVSGSELEMFSIKLRNNDDRHRIHLENATLINISSLASRDPWIHAPAWRVRAEVKSVKDLPRDPTTTIGGSINGGSGLKQGPVYALMELDAAIGSAFERGHRLGVGAKMGFLTNARSRAVTHINAMAMRYPTGNIGNTVRFNAIQTLHLSKKWMARLSWERQNHYQETILSLNRYF